MTKFGPSGSSLSFTTEGYTKTEQAAPWLKARGLDCYEYSFGRGVQMGESKAIAIGEAFTAAGIEVSVHAPYYVNFGNPDEEAAAKSCDYVLRSARMVRLMGGRRTVFHPASQGTAAREAAFAKTRDRIKTLRDYIFANAMEDLLFCPETMGKFGQIGTVEEVTELCKIDPVFLPAVDFGHVNAREQGSLKTSADYQSRLEYMIGELGFARMKHFHVHFSKIQYGQRGEVRHLTFEDRVYGPEFLPLAEALVELGLEPVILSESQGTQAEDARTMKDLYFSVLGAKITPNN